MPYSKEYQDFKIVVLQLGSEMQNLVTEGGEIFD
jgi:hypothetical protein